MFDYWIPNALSTSIMTIIGWGILIGAVCYLYRKQTEKPVIWKMVIIIYIGLFCFNFSFIVSETPVKIAILPLGVWILILVFGKRKERWKVYRPFAWLGFFGNYIFLITTLLSSLVQSLLYPTDKVETFLAELNNPGILLIHPSGKQADLNKELFIESLSSWGIGKMDTQQWYYESFPEIKEEELEEEGQMPHQTMERFPYILIGATPKWGIGYESTIYMERDGKGMLISTEKGQYYFRSSESVLKGGTE
ncbi:hypothetical protein HRF69_14320 [Bacillus circulans]|uniref:hypothetical protein n=1 Tax=Niallia circulans TaxID=1397 RepID=UPI0014904E72|nr:hypothetical protein [Niallia circulans]NRG28295.1 hypothetical protein [Niallia circulans]QJX62594.1 hypothetical protein HLK66_13675 [Niallia circulans]UQZ77250.1 hypothetical protein C2I17_23345 [Niallia circulans]